ADKVKEVKASTKKGELEKLQLELLKIKLDALESAAREGKISPEILDAELKSLEARIAMLEKFIEK
ncbi:MAG: ABC transporter ATP-binding protein, partial [Thermofilum sp.]|nr:ABC transporter ATP-binding protein [Thermofilum sp.]